MKEVFSLKTFDEKNLSENDGSRMTNEVENSFSDGTEVNSASGSSNCRSEINSADYVGSYSYKLEPNGQKSSGHNKKSKKVVALSILIVVCMVMSSIATSFMITALYENGLIFKNGVKGNGQGNEEAEKAPASGGVDNKVIIIKGEGTKDTLPEGSIGVFGMSVAQISALVADSVVEITTSSVMYDGFYGQQIVSGAGSGVIIGRAEEDSELYYIVTNHHVIDGAEKIYLRLRNGNEYACKLIGSDIISDIAILEISSKEVLTVAHLGNSDNLLVGEEVVVIGNPLGQLGGTVTNGIISALERKVKVDELDMTLLQTNAAISPGNSGGGMFNTAGELIGIINAKSSAESAEGLGFAIPVNYAETIIKDILSYGYVRNRAALPFAVQEYSSTSVFGSVSNFIIVTSENDENDVQFNDVIYSVNGTKVTSMNGLISLLSNYNIGDVVEIQVARTVGREVRFYNQDVTLVESTQ